MIVWFAVLGVAGIGGIMRHPQVIAGLSPTYAVAFVAAHPYIAFVAIGAIVLVITGAEALYADMGHFGRPADRAGLVHLRLPRADPELPGPGGADPHRARARRRTRSSCSLPGWARLPMVVLATMATVIASQAVISGAFSVSRQAMQLGFLPAQTVRQTSKHEGGQVYLPAVNGLLFVGVLVLVLAFESSPAARDGLRRRGHRRAAHRHGPHARRGAAPVALADLAAGPGRRRLRRRRAGLPRRQPRQGHARRLAAAARRGSRLHGHDDVAGAAAGSSRGTGRRSRARCRSSSTGSTNTRSRRVPGTAVFPHPSKDTVPLALRANVERNHVRHQRVVIVSAKAATVPYVHHDERLQIDDLGFDDDGIYHVTVRYGFSEPPDIPQALEQARDEGMLAPGRRPRRRLLLPLPGLDPGHAGARA